MTQKQHRLARRQGAAPSQYLKRHFVALARQVSQWADQHEKPIHQTGFTIGVTSLDKRVGKSNISFNLGAALTTFARCQTLLIEADFGNPFLSRRLGFSHQPGLTEILTSDMSLEDGLRETPVPNLQLIGCGQLSDQSSLELPFDQLPHVMEDHSVSFGYTVVDLPVASHLTACYSITPHLDGVILAVEPDQINQQQIERFRQQLDQHQTSIIGVVINKA